MAKYTGCPKCGKTILEQAPLCPHCGALFREATAQDRAAAARRAGGWYCTQCGTIGARRTYTKGSFLVEVFLWLLLILPGVIYSVWRLASRYRGCPACGAPHMVPAASPVAQAALGRLAGRP